MAKRDPYSVLGVSRAASEAELKRAYRKLARQYHPDMNGNSKVAEVRFKEISEAYEILSDQEKRQRYDMYGHEGVNADFGGFGSSTGRNPFEGVRFGNRGYSFNFGNFSGNTGQGFFEDVFSEFQRAGGGRGARRPSAQPGKDIEYNLTVDFLQAYQGMAAELSILDRRIDVRIPAGVDNGSKVRVAGQGAPGLRGGRPGDLYLNIRVTPHEYFRREAHDIHLTVPITFGEAVLGARVELPGPEGRLALKIPAGTQSGTNFRFKGKGFPDLKGTKSRGDFFVTVQIAVPDTIDSASRDLVAEFERRNPHDPRKGRY
jgi:DnaJ-class molecular chaperone